MSRNVQGPSQVVSSDRSLGSLPPIFGKASAFLGASIALKRRSPEIATLSHTLISTPMNTSHQDNIRTATVTQHITRLAFCGLRRLNAKEIITHSEFKEWARHREWHELGQINIFIGPNGGGKSTILDLVHSMSDPRQLTNLPRENMIPDTLSAFEIQLSGGARYLGQSISNRVSGATNASNIQDTPGGGLDIQFLEVGCVDEEGKFHSFSRNISKIKLDEDSASAIEKILSNLPCNISFWQPNNESNPEVLARILNRAADHLPGVLSPAAKIPDRDKIFIDHIAHKRREPFNAHDEDRLAVWLSDDVRQQNHVHVEAMPSGWRRLASILGWLSNCRTGTICLIEEPENHLHPTLQRHLAREIDRLANENELQILIATHSPVFQQMNIWESTAKVFSTESDKITEYSKSRNMLDQLGIKASDLSQSNGIIWVEGAADRIYIKHWMSLWCKSSNIAPPLENVDYSFAFYGGSLLSHFSTEETDDFIEMMKINRNFAIVMDRDLDFSVDDNGSLTLLSPNSAKSRIIREIENKETETILAWVTDGYTIENYLPREFFKEHFSTENNGIVTTKRGKVEVARKYVKKFDSFSDCSGIPRLEYWIETLTKRALSWNL